MKTFIAETLFGVLISATLAFASSAHTGQFWDRLSSSAKYAYVNGYSDAMSFSIAELGGLKAAAEVFHWKGARRFSGSCRTSPSRISILN